MYLRVAVPVLDVRHERESLAPHAVAALPQARDVVGAQRAVRRDGVQLHLLGHAEGLPAALPLAHEGGLDGDEEGKQQVPHTP